MEDYIRKHQQRKVKKFSEDLAIYDDAKKAYEAGEITLEELRAIAETLDL